MHTLRGIAVSPGIAIGPVRVLDPRGLRPIPRAVSIEAVPAEFYRLDRALELARVEAEAAELEARQRIGPQYADILAAHGRMIDDPILSKALNGPRYSGETTGSTLRSPWWVDPRLDLRRGLRSEPILARRIGMLGRAWRWGRRNPSLAAMTGLAALLLVCLAAGATAGGKADDVIDVEFEEKK